MIRHLYIVLKHAALESTASTFLKAQTSAPPERFSSAVSSGSSSSAPAGLLPRPRPLPPRPRPLAIFVSPTDTDSDRKLAA